MPNIYNLSEQLRIINDETYCIRCRWVAANEFLNNRKVRDSSNPGEAVKAYKLTGEPVSPETHTHIPGKCNAPVDWKY